MVLDSLSKLRKKEHNLRDEEKIERGIERLFESVKPDYEKAVIPFDHNDNKSESEEIKS